MKFDLNKFEEVLYEESKKIFPKIIQDCESEGIYSLALYNSGDSWSYLFPTVATMKGLSNVAAEYKKDEYYKDKTIEYLEADLKWSPCDSPKHEDYESSMIETDKIVQSASKLMDELFDNDKEVECDELHQQLVKTSLNVMKRLDSEGVFGSLERSSFVLNLLNGDQCDEERLERANFLNPENVYQTYKNEI
ncbi:DUF4303 domain-containing protein [Pseudomonas sp. HK3]|jgi:hypothetical protein